MDRKKITALFLTLAFIFNLLEYATPARTAFSDIVDVVITCDGMEENSITMSENEKITLTACEERADSYQWQIQLPYSELWVDIYDKTDSQCEVGYTLVEPCLNEDNTVKLRCQAEIDEAEYSSDEITVSIAENELMPTFPENFHAEMMSQLQPSILDDEPDSATRTVTIKYLYYNEAPDNDGSVANDYVATIAKGESYSRRVQSPVRTGYKAYIADIDEWNAAEGKWLTDLDETLIPYDNNPKNGSAVHCSVTDLQDDVIYYVIYIPQEVEFHVSRYQQNIYDDLYTFVNSETLSAKVGTVITNQSDIREAFEGFSILQYNDATVAADGSTLVEVFYDREYHLMNFQLDGGYGVEPVYARYGTEFHVTQPTRAGYKFLRWEAIPDSSRSDEQNTQAEEIAAALTNGETFTIPAFDIVFQAVWETQSVSATVVFWYENADDDGYSYKNHVVVDNLEPDSEISSETYKNLSFNGRDTQHFTYNPEKAETVTVNGDGSTYLNIYFTRNVYTVVFTNQEGSYPLVEGCTIEEHTHDNCFDVTHHVPMCYGATTNKLTIPVNHYGYVDYISKIYNPTNGLMACYLNKAGTTYAYYIYVDQWYYLGETAKNDPPPTFSGIEWTGRRPTASLSYTTYQIHHSDTCYSYERFGATSKLTPASSKNNGYDANYILSITDPTDGLMVCYKGKTTYNYYFYDSGVWYHLGTFENADAVENPTLNGLYFGGNHTPEDVNFKMEQYQLTPATLHCDIPEHIHGHTDDCNGTKTVETGAGDYIYQVIKAKYSQDITNVWPMAGQNYGYATVPTNYSSWTYMGYNRTEETIQITRQNTMIPELCNPNGQIVPLVTTNTPKEVHANYHTESLTGNGAYSYKGKTYDLDPRYTQIIPMTLNNAKRIDGFTPVSGTPTGAMIEDLYYDRNRWNIKFDNGYGTTFAIVSDVMFEQPLENVTYQGKPLSEVVPPYPATLQKGTYEFEGWYTTPGHIPGTEADFNIIMPNQDLIYYAKWKKVTHTVTFYETYNDMLNENPITDTSYGINPGQAVHGETVQYASTISRDGYDFVGWFYIDEETGEKKAFLPNNMPVNRDLNIFAEWKATSMIRYTIKYMGAEAVKDVNGEYLMPDGRYTLDTSNSKPVALETTGQFQDGRTKTFSAKTMNELYSDYSSKYFPIISSHAIMFMDNTDETDPDVTVKHNKDGSYSIEYTFYYVYLEKSKYTVEYINSETGDNIFPSGTVPGITVETENSVVTERFKNIPDYSPDEYQKRLILTADPSQNVIRFYYSPNSNPTYYVEHLTENPDGTWTIQASEFSSGSSGETISRSPNSYTGHIFDKNHAWVDTQGEPLTIGENEKWAEASDFSSNQYSYKLENGKTLVIRFFYPLAEYDCIIEHRILSSKEYLFGSKENSTETFKAKYGTRFQGDAAKVRDNALALGYWVDGSNTDETRLHQSKIVTESNNVITFWYVDEPIEINYRVKIKDTTGMNVYGNFVTPTLDNTNSHKVNDQLQGSTPHLVAGYHFVNWYKDEECSQAVDPSWITDDNTLTPAPEGENNIIKAATYYAKIDPNTLTITKDGDEVNENDTFLFKVTGNGIDMTVSIKGTGSTVIEFIPNGTYTVEEVSKWSWKYNAVSSQTVTVNASGTVTFTNTKDTTNRWLSGESSINNKFSAFGN